MRRIRKLAVLLFVCMMVSIAGPENVTHLTGTVEVQAAAKVTAPKLVSVKDSGASKAVLKWNAVKDVNGYRIYRKTAGAKSWTAIKTVSGANTVSFTDSKLKSGTRYYYTVRAYKKISGQTV